MKKALAPFAMIARHSLGMVMFILGLLILGNGILFHMELGTEPRNLAVLLDESQLRAVFWAVYMALSFFLCRAMRDKGGHQDYFLGRLRISRRRFYLVHAMYNSLCYFLLFAAEALSLLAMCMITVSRFPESYNHQSIVVACYQSEQLHIVFPMSDWLGWLTNIVLILGLGFCTAAVPARNRRGKSSLASAFMMCFFLVYLFLQQEIGTIYEDYKITALIVTPQLGFASCIGVYRLEGEVDEQI